MGKLKLSYGLFQWDGKSNYLEPRFVSLLSSAVAGFDPAPARRLYRKIGIDPTKTRPSCEALYRRVSRKGEFPRIHPVVDGINLLSLITSLPYGLYDADKIQGEVRARIGRKGEGYRGIGRDWVNLEGRILLEDSQGPFGNPTGDSFRTKVEEGTVRFLYVIFAPPDYRIEGADRLTRDRIREWFAAEVKEGGILP